MMIIDVKIARTHVQRARYVRTWFWMGVPLSAMRHLAFNLKMDLAVEESGFLTVCASSRITQSQIYMNMKKFIGNFTVNSNVKCKIIKRD